MYKYFAKSKSAVQFIKVLDNFLNFEMRSLKIKRHFFGLIRNGRVQGTIWTI